MLNGCRSFDCSFYKLFNELLTKMWLYHVNDMLDLGQELRFICNYDEIDETQKRKSHGVNISKFGGLFGIKISMSDYRIVKDDGVNSG